MWVCVFLLFCPLISFPQRYLDYQDPQIIRLLRDGIEASFGEEYATAEAKFDTLIRMAPEDPAGYFFKAALLHAQMIDYESDFREEEFYANVKKAKKLAKGRIEGNRKDAWTYLVLGNTYGAKAVYDAKQGKWLSALQEGLMAKSALKEALERNPQLYDAYVGLGSYHYWASVMTKALRWLPFVGDHREQGIAEMKLAYEKSIFSSTAAASGLVWIYIREGEFDRAINLARQMQSAYPEGKSFLWPLAEAHYDKRDWSKALSGYRELLDRLQIEHNHEDVDQSYNLVESRFYIANCLFGLRRYAECDSVCQEVLDFPLDEEVRKRQKARLKKIQELSEMCRELAERKR
jgi:tetratricopeptide (TPR) repeat protein